MKILLVRVDDRLIHGQILEAWIPALKAQAVIVANDALACDQFQKTILSMAIPHNIVLKIVTIDSTLDLENDPAIEFKNVLLIVSSINDAYLLFKNGVKFPKLNLGNMKAKTGCMQLSCSAWLENEDIPDIREMLDSGITITVQSVPREREIDIKTIMDSVKT